ncbi:MAG: LysM domain-containing protein [Planctomycetota bacterium]
MGIAVVMSEGVRRKTRAVGWRALLLVPIMVGPGCIGQQSSRATKEPAAAKKRTATSQPSGPREPKIDVNGLPGRVHIVQPGDTLYSIAEQYYGHNKYFRQIFTANRNRLADPKHMPVGMRLIIPPLPPEPPPP